MSDITRLYDVRYTWSRTILEVKFGALIALGAGGMALAWAFLAIILIGLPLELLGFTIDANTLGALSAIPGALHGAGGMAAIGAADHKESMKQLSDAAMQRWKVRHGLAK